jgi:hypothetical protein
MRRPLWQLGVMASKDLTNFREASFDFNVRERLKALLRTDLDKVAAADGAYLEGNPKGGQITGLAVSINGGDATKVDVAAGLAFDYEGEYVKIESDPTTPADLGPDRPARVALAPDAGGDTQYLYVKWVAIDSPVTVTDATGIVDVYRAGFAAGDTRRWDSYEFGFKTTDPDNTTDEWLPLAKINLSGGVVQSVDDLRPPMVLGTRRYEPYLHDLSPIGWFWPWKGFTGSDDAGWLLPTGFSIVSTTSGDDPGVGGYAPDLINIGDGIDLPALAPPGWLFGRTSDVKLVTTWVIPDDIHVPVSGDGAFLRFEVYVRWFESPRLLGENGRFRLGSIGPTGTLNEQGADNLIAVDAAAAWVTYDIPLATIGAVAGDVIRLFVSGENTTPAGMGNAVFVHGRIRGFRTLRSAVRIGSL